jgi:hypothetical protein
MNVADQSNANMNSYTNFWNTYALDNLTLFNSWNQSIKSTFLTGAYNFKTIEIEVYASKFFYLILFSFIQNQIKYFLFKCVLSI